MDNIPVAMAFVAFEGQILVLQQRGGSHLVVPGGQSSAEHQRQNLRIFAKKQTGLDIIVGEPFSEAEWKGKVGGQERNLYGTFYACKVLRPVVELGDAYVQSAWIVPACFREAGVAQSLWIPFHEYVKKYGKKA